MKDKCSNDKRYKRPNEMFSICIENLRLWHLRYLLFQLLNNFKRITVPLTKY